MTLSGISKGAATMVNTVGTLAQQKPSLLKNVQAVIVDSPFASPESVAHNVIRSKFPSFFHKFVTWSLATTPIKFMTKLALKKLYPGYDPTKITPLKAVQELWQHVDKNMVIVIIHSQKDELIHVNDSRMLYLELKKLGFNNLYFIETTQGVHGKADWESENKAVADALNLIYLKHKLPLPQCYHKSAQRFYEIIEKYEETSTGKSAFFAELSNVQPSIDVVQGRIYR